MNGRIRDLIQCMTVEEKASQLLHESPAIERLGIPAYNWWNEALHGVARAGVATVFPQVIGLAASFDEELIGRVAAAISDEGRAKYNESVRHGNRGKYHGLTYWTPNVNIFRDPRWGRGQETFGEDPYLTALLGTAFVRGLQGDSPDRLKTAACAKHFAVHSGPEKLRHEFDAIVSRKDLWETYLPAFKALVDAGVEAVMGAYNRTLGEPCCGSSLLMEDILRSRWGFKGHYVSDCWAIRDFHEHHRITSSPAESVALALSRGCDLNCGSTYTFLLEALHLGLITEPQIDTALERLLNTRMKLGMFDPPGQGPYDHLDASVIRCPAHLDLAKEAALKSVVLLRNKGKLLPLNGDRKTILLIGPGAANIHTLLGNYHGLSPRLVTVLEGLTEKVKDKPGISLNYTQGCMMYAQNLNTGWTLGMAETADVVIAVFGLDNAMEGEEGDAIASEAKGDRASIELPPWQLAYLKALKERGTPTVLILTGGSPVAFPEDIADTVLFAWYPGEQGGSAIADLVFGDAVPSGKLPVTFPAATGQLPPYDDYAMKGRTYRYMTDEPLYPFGFGLSYTTFRLHSPLQSSQYLDRKTGITIGCTVENTGGYESGQTLQIYVGKENPGPDEPVHSLRAVRNMILAPGESSVIRVTLNPGDFMSVNNQGQMVLAAGRYTVTIADACPVPSAAAKGAVLPVALSVTVE
ncbi:MAG: glycoside hydrolase family 3 C-terminal domain-containing protein [Spirochaetales bacterium]|nr:glycoside hydrolase family 3 C-terminal domain-containing protein [Spirochaetales bacterium]